MISISFIASIICFLMAIIIPVRMFEEWYMDHTANPSITYAIRVALLAFTFTILFGFFGLYFKNKHSNGLTNTSNFTIFNTIPTKQ